ncbi:unnamed protein product [Trichogramma brassicae]|uniref:Reverse transcriptase/retrotransposon-derived protein RNase H-like domain-containing protein n=1 Tax=Trichogramma brassicae TaxID=86971 RepID=A0A6H5I2P0_9HYME|nr:unnamed protein product [Trichogramma brassicae]
MFYHATGQMPRRHKRRRSALDRCGPGHAERRSGSVVPRRASVLQVLEALRELLPKDVHRQARRIQAAAGATQSPTGRRRINSHFIVYFNFYLSHLTEKPSRREQVKIAWNNIRPEYRSALCNRMPKSLKEIQKAGERFEEALAISGNSKRNESETILPLTPKPPRQTHRSRPCRRLTRRTPRRKKHAGPSPKKKRTPKKKRDKPEEKRRSGAKRTQADDRSWPTATSDDECASGAARGNNFALRRRVFHLPRKRPSRQRMPATPLLPLPRDWPSGNLNAPERRRPHVKCAEHQTLSSAIARDALRTDRPGETATRGGRTVRCRPRRGARIRTDHREAYLSGTTADVTQRPALYDPGAQSSFIEPKIARKLASRLQGRATAVKGPCSPGVTTTLGRLDVQVHINGKTERMQWRAMSYLDHDIILGADFKNLWAVDTQTVEGEWRVHKALGCRSTEKVQIARRTSRGVCEPRDSLCSRASLHQSSARSCAWEHDDSEAESLECAGLSEITPGTRGSDPRCRLIGTCSTEMACASTRTKVAPVMNYPAPTDLKSLRRFLGMLGWYARFIPNDAEMKLPLLKLTKKNAEWIWADEQQQAFEALKKALTEAPVLARPDFARPFIVQCDASALAIGGVLSQVFDDGEHPIVYVSRVFTSAERNYTTSEKECLALLWTIRKLRPYLEGYKFIAVTDHSALHICAISRTRQAVLPDGPWRYATMGVRDSTPARQST